jgi:mono/diheme cytochrome c family protein
MRTNHWPSRFAVTAGVVFALGLFACAAAQTPRDRIADPGELLFNGYTSPDVDCYRCHKGDGTGSWRGPNLAEVVPKMTDAAIAKTIHEGPGLMPSYQGKIDDQQIAAITAWLRGKFK